MNLGAVLTDLGGGIVDMFVTIITKLTSIFFSLGEEGAIEFTALGYIALIGLVISVVYFGIRWITSLIKQRSSTR